jgi:hypothetical protein
MTYVTAPTTNRNAKAAKPAKKIRFAVFARFAFPIVTR